MANYFFTQKAVEDLTSIWNYTYEAWSENQADKYYEGLIKSCQKISKNPEIGKRYAEIEFSLLGYLYKKHIIFYRTISMDEVEITRILHSSMDLKNRIRE